MMNRLQKFNPLRIRIFDWIPVRYRISAMLVGLTVGTLLCASAIGFFPNEQRGILIGRAKLCETLAISSTAMVSNNDVAGLKAVIEAVVKRDEQIDSIGFRLVDGALMVEAGNHEERWSQVSDNSRRQSSVPVFKHGEKYGALEISFKSTGGFLGLNYWAPAWLLVVLIPGCFVQFSIFLRRALDSLDPNGAVPKRVENTFDQVLVGIVVTDLRDRILLPNKTFCDLIGLEREKLFGSSPSKIDWILEDGESELPWIESTRTGDMGKRSNPETAT